MGESRSQRGIEGEARKKRLKSYEDIQGITGRNKRRNEETKNPKRTGTNNGREMKMEGWIVVAVAVAVAIGVVVWRPSSVIIIIIHPMKGAEGTLRWLRNILLP
jgi:Flp pilus assembly protein TadB